ncbi:MAG: C1 family peptidase [Patescibacteria group bacterium]|nr:C1 family peptidase [Patescibacteria group bacterium]
MASVTPKLGKGLGCKPTTPDARDSKLSLTSHLGISALPPDKIDVFDGLPIKDFVYDQAAEGSCTANAGVNMRRFLAQKWSRFSAPDCDLSREFLYESERLLPWNADPTQDSGAQIRDIGYVLTHTGVCPEPDDPYMPSNLYIPPTDPRWTQAAENAKPYKGGAYHFLTTIDQMVSVLASGYPFLVGFTVYNGIENLNSSGLMPFPQPGEQPLGGHATCIHGYDLPNRVFIDRNSWGKDWGLNGDFLIPFEFIQNTVISAPTAMLFHLGKPWVA